MAEVLLRRGGTLERLDRSTLVGRYVPWDQPAAVIDMTASGVERYREGFRRGAFDAQTRGSAETVHFITFVDQHEGGLGKLGYTLNLRDADDGLWGEIRVLPTRLDDVDAMLGDGITGLSVGFRSVSHRDESGVRWRTKARLDHVALEALGAYPSAQVLAWRVADDEAATQTAIRADRAARLSALSSWCAEQEARQAELLAREVRR